MSEGESAEERRRRAEDLESPAEARPLSALPSARARWLAFAGILVGGVCGALIGAAFVNLQCHGDCTTPSGIGAVVGALSASGGVAVVAVLTLRAMGEWRRISAARQTEGAAGPSGPSRPPAG